MRVAICSSFVPFVKGGGRFIVDWLEQKLRENGHRVEVIYLPFTSETDFILPQFLSYRLLDLSQSCDRLIAIRPPAHLIPHPNKVLWFIHHLRQYYDLWDTPHCDIPHDDKQRAIREQIMEADGVGLREAKKVFTNSQVMTDRIKRYNHIESEVLYPPLLEPDLFQPGSYGDEIVYMSRVEPHKRQHLLIEAFRYVRTPVKLRICGVSSAPGYALELKALIDKYGLSNSVTFENRWISEDEKRAFLTDALCVAYLPEDEDSYGYPSLEASHAEKAILTTLDSGGVRELVQDYHNGRVLEPEPKAMAAAMDELYEKRDLAARMGKAARQRLGDLNINWDHVISRLLS